ncbi:MAG: hypothetical protein ACKPEY_14230 [Planctomycetota bacterium]
MSLTVYEKAGSPRARFVNATSNNGSSIEFTYVVLGTNSEADAANGALAVAPLAYVVNSETLVRQEANPTPTGPDSWEVSVHYGTEDQQQSQETPEPGTWHFNFDTTGGTHTITQSLQNVWRGERSQVNPAPNLLGAINYDGKKVQGVEIVVPKLEFSITAYYAPQTVTTTFVANIARQTGKVNSSTWLGFAAGELLFLGGGGQGDIPTAAGQRVKPIPITFKFAASENRTNIQVGEITVPSKAGWDYLWVRYEKTESNGTVYPIPVHAYVEKVYERFEFAQLFGFG